MKKAYVELYKQANCFQGYGFVPWLLHDKGIKSDEVLMKWANQNKAFVYKHQVIERFQVYKPVQRDDNNHILGDSSIELEIYYYDMEEKPEKLYKN